MGVELGNSPESWGVMDPGDPGQTPWNRFLDEVAQAGYDWIELGHYGYLPTDPTILRAELDKRGLKLSGGVVIAPLDDSDSWLELEKQIVRVGELLKALGAKYLNLVERSYNSRSTSGRQSPERLDEDAWRRLIENTHQAADLARDRFGLQLAFHPCIDTHVQYEDEIEALLEQSDPERVSLCLDTGHHAYCGGDPVNFMRAHHDRICYLHLKSVDEELQRRVEVENIPVATAAQMGVFCEPSAGSVDFKAFAEVLEGVGYEGIAIVEQAIISPPPGVPLGIARRSREYFRQVGIG